MKILITGACGFVGSTLAAELIKCHEGVQLTGLDNLSRPGSELNRRTLRQLGSRYLFICLCIWLEKYLSRGDYKRQ